MSGESGFNFEDRADARILRDGNLLALVQQASKLGLGGMFHVECYDKDGNLKWKDVAKNGVTVVGIHHVLETVFRGGTPSTTWYMGLIVDPVSGGGPSENDTMSSHANWTEDTDYSETNRPTWAPDAAAAKAITNSTTTADFTINLDGDLYGIFIVDDNSKSGTSGVLFSTAPFSGGKQSVKASDVLKVTYTLNGTNV